MKVPGSVRSAYQQCLEVQAPLKMRADEAFNARRKPRWHYESRIKELESFALKLETGRVPDPLRLEDFFACTLVVENHAALAEARELVEELTTVQSERPPHPGRTSKKPTDFRFDDLRMYVSWREDPALPKVPYAGVTFEVQTKTFLQHAWGIATHDLVYKANRVSWPLERVAHQIKAMLEHAEVSISGAEDLAKTEILNLESSNYVVLQNIISFLEAHWASSALPSDRVRLARNVASLLAGLSIDLPLVEESLDAETRLGRGTATLNLSPFGILVQALLAQHSEVFDKLGQKSDEFRLFLPVEIEGRESLAEKKPSAVVVL